MAGVYSLRDVAEHNTAEEPWLIIDDKVYNVKKLLPDHPGGEFILLSNAGKNATTAFERKGHSENAKRWMKDFQIG
ncbi:hypothetical protein HELRODRAFT_152794, partial [Helobdella robusta]|uniref:Cytochrome b5 n=1 Tax=Helobdella robusta TaxID=6412 RepID=T1EKX0_HELRO